MNSVLLVNALIGGLVFGAIYALIGASLNVMMGVLRVVNFAHGEFVLVGSFIAYTVLSLTGLNPLFALPVVALVMFFAGIGAYYVLIPRLQFSDDPETSSFLLMFGVSLMLVSLITWIYGADIRPVNFSFDPVNFTLFSIPDAYGPGRDGKVLVPTARLVALGINLAIIAAMTWFVYRTLAGKALRGAIMNRDAIQVVGIDVDRLSASAFGLAAALAGVTGVILTLVIPSVDPNGGAPLTLFAFIVIVIGGLGHPIGALVGGVLFGVVEQFSNVLLPQSAAQMVGFVMLVGVVMLKPEGLFGRRVMR